MGGLVGAQLRVALDFRLDGVEALRDALKICWCGVVLTLQVALMLQVVNLACLKRRVAAWVRAFVPPETFKLGVGETNARRRMGVFWTCVRTLHCLHPLAKRIGLLQCDVVTVSASISLRAMGRSSDISAESDVAALAVRVGGGQCSQPAMSVQLTTGWRPSLPRLRCVGRVAP